MRKVFISGGLGFIGTHLVHHIQKKFPQTKIVVYDNLSSRKQSFLRSRKNTTIVLQDLKNPKAVRRAMKGCDTVFHLAANPDIARAVREPDIDFWEGTFLANNVLEAMRVHGVKKIFYTSGSGVYGEDPAISFREDYGPCVPISTYGASKLACEALIASYGHMFGMQARVFRFANVVGPQQTHGVGYDFVRQLKKNPAALRILGDGWQSKSYIHVDDILRAMFYSDRRNRKTYDVFNVASGDYLTVRAIARIVCRTGGLRGVRMSFTGGDRGWKGDVPIVRFDCTKIKKTGWRPLLNSADAMEDAVASMWQDPQVV